ncbi:hypothetical protein Tco_1525398, partial [Tanacetum coccineum]
VEPGNVNMKVLEDFTKEPRKGQPKICKTEAMSIQPNIPVRSIKYGLVTLGEHYLILRRNGIGRKEARKFFLSKNTCLCANNIFAPIVKNEANDELT